MRPRTTRPGSPLSRASIMVTVAGSAIGLGAVTAGAQVSGESVARGQAQFSRAPGLTTITASNGAIINYQSFSIPQGQGVRFIQPDSSSRVLNRINSAVPSRIDGSLTANGRVYITNPAGVIFGATSVINAAGIYAAAGTISDANFLGGVNHFTNVTGPVVNQGVISASGVALVGKRVENHGKIVADGGMVTMASGSDVLIREGNGRIYARIDGREINSNAPAGTLGGAPGTTQAGVTNTGTISAKGGIVTLGAGDAVSLAIMNTGRIEAAGGTVNATTGIGILRNDGVITASVEAGNAGSVIAKGAAVVNTGTISADSGNGRAGSVEVTSSRLTFLGSGSVVSAKGGAGVAEGGHVLVHAYQGDTYVSRGATVDVSGGTAGGNGGVGEISASRRLALFGTIRGDAVPGFAPASILFDPLNIAIRTPGANDSELDDGQILAGDGGDSNFTVSPGAIEGFAGNVTLEASQDIQFFESVDKSNGGLSLLAGRDIIFGGDDGKKGNGIPGGGGSQDISISASFLIFEAGANIRDLTQFGALLASTTSGISTKATTGSVQFGLATVPPGRTLSITQAESKFVGASEFGFVGSPTTTHLVINITDGYLIFGGEFGGVSGFQEILSVEANASEFLRVEDNLDILAFADFNSDGNVEIDGFIHADGPLALHSGLDGSGDVVFLSPGLDLWSNSISLRAGSGSGFADARVDARTNSPMFRGIGGGETRPDTFVFEQDAPVFDSDRPLASQFGAPLAGMVYRIESYDAGVVIDDASSVDGTALTLASQTGSTINNDLSLASLDVFGKALLNADVAATAHQTYNGAVTLGGDRTLTATTVTFNSTVNGSSAGTEFLAIIGDMVTEDAIGESVILESLSVTGTSAINGGRITTVGEQLYGGAVTLGADTLLSASRVRFNSTVDGSTPGQEALFISQDMLLNGAMGDTVALELLDVLGDSALNGGIITTTGTQNYVGAVVLGADTTLTGTSVRFGSTVESGADIGRALTVAGDMIAEGAIGDVQALRSLHVTGSSALNGRIVVTALGQTYDGPVTLGADSFLTASLVTFGGTVDAAQSAAQALTIFGDMAANGAMGGSAPLNSLTVNGQSALAGRVVTTAGDQTYNGSVSLLDDAALTSLADGEMFFGGTVDGAHNLDISTTASGLIVFTDDVGATEALVDLRLSTAGGSAGRTIPTVATIVGDRSRAISQEEPTGTDLRFHVRDFVMGQNEKFTTLGSLSISASRHAVLGDLTTIGDMTVAAPTITILRREGSQLLDWRGELVNDRGVDFVAGGRISFAGGVVLAGTATPPPTFADNGQNVTRGSLQGFEFTRSTPEQTSREALTFDGVVLDQRTLAPAIIPPPTPVPPTDSGADLAEALAPRIRFSDSVQPEAYDLRLFQRLSINARGVSEEEISDALIGRLVYNDLPSGVETFNREERRFAATRADIDSVLRIVGERDAAFGTPDADQTQAIAASLAESANRYFTLSGASRIDPVEFRKFLESSPQEQRTLAYIQQLQAVLSDMKTLGLPASEYQQSQVRLLSQVAPQGRMSVGELVQLIQTPGAAPSGS